MEACEIIYEKGSDNARKMFSFPLQLLLKEINYLPKWRHYHRTLGILVKIKDDPGGYINPDGTFSKPLTENDLDRLEYGVGLAKQVLQKAGAPNSSIYTTPIRGAHPGGTAAIGKVVDLDLATEIKNLFVAAANPVKGAENASVTIIEYFDFQCPYCARGAKSVSRLLKIYPEKVKLAFKNLPLSFHKQALPAAKVVLAAHKQGKF